MKLKKVLKIIASVLGVLLLLCACFIGINYYNYKYRYLPKNILFTQSAEYINPDEAKFSEGFKTCDEKYIIQYYNPERATYSEGKNGLRKFIMSNYENRNYIDSGYLNIRFVINCKGEAGRYIIHENDLNLKPKKFNKDLVHQLFELTTQLKKWNPNFTHDEFRDSYMYLSYRIENGNITEIIP